MKIQNQAQFISLQKKDHELTDNMKHQREAAKKFESIFIRQLFTIMEKSMGGGKLFGGGFSGKIYKDLFIDKLAEKSATGKGIGIAEMILNYWRRTKNPEIKSVNANDPSKEFEILSAFNRMNLEKRDE